MSDQSREEQSGKRPIAGAGRGRVVETNALAGRDPGVSVEEQSRWARRWHSRRTRPKGRDRGAGGGLNTFEKGPTVEHTDRRPISCGR